MPRIKSGRPSRRCLGRSGARLPTAETTTMTLISNSAPAGLSVTPAVDYGRPAGSLVAEALDEGFCLVPYMPTRCTVPEVPERLQPFVRGRVPTGDVMDGLNRYWLGARKPRRKNLSGPCCGRWLYPRALGTHLNYSESSDRRCLNHIPTKGIRLFTLRALYRRQGRRISHYDSVKTAQRRGVDRGDTEAWWARRVYLDSEVKVHLVSIQQ